VDYILIKMETHDTRLQRVDDLLHSLETKRIKPKKLGSTSPSSQSAFRFSKQQYTVLLKRLDAIEKQNATQHKKSL